ncbi:hypothetical protein WN944_023144 [Citrus x changshan-huyou]|uniref:NAC domain-containing protein n=1 Tax=Citrus x changshan-huyou TaxID=2935761 RepID=A0AAP0MZS9_9ROSI
MIGVKCKDTLKDVKYNFYGFCPRHRFKPTNEEIISLLKKKRLDPGFSVHTIKEIDFYSFDPWDLPRHSEIQGEEEVWYYYCERYYKYAKSKRAHRRTKSGYWKVTGTATVKWECLYKTRLQRHLIDLMEDHP